MGLFALGAIYGAAPVEESVAEDLARDAAEQRTGATPGDPSSTMTDEAAAGTSQLGQLFYQLQLLRDELQRLNGSLEEQQNQIERLAREQHERYLGLDKRIMELSADREAIPTADTTSGPSELANLPSTPIGPPKERDTYESAYELMQRREFVSAAEVFEQLIDEYPNGEYTPNAFYWLGELHRKNGDVEAARQSFVQVVALYPDHNKVPDALYKLGVVYTQLDELERAMEYLDRVMREYPDSTAASLAKQHAEELRQ